MQTKIDKILESDGYGREVFDYVTSGRGKGLRPSLVFLTFDLCGGLRYSEAIDSATGVELVHMASLIHDDIIDRSELRRGQVTVHRKFGTQVAVLAGDHLFAAAFHLFALSPTNKVSQVMTGVIQEMCLGEINQLLDPVTAEKDYFDYVYKKTACLIGGCCRLGAILADRDEDRGAVLQEFGEKIGLAFQLADDVLDYRGQAALMGKRAGKDFAQQVWTLPIIRAHRRGLVPDNWFEYDFSSIRYILEQRGIFDEVWQVASGYVDEAAEILERFPNSSAKAELALLLEKLMNRHS